jgi:hypothetical protein
MISSHQQWFGLVQNKWNIVQQQNLSVPTTDKNVYKRKHC